MPEGDPEAAQQSWCSPPPSPALHRSARRASVVSGSARRRRGQVTRIVDTAKGNRPSFSGAAPPEEAELLYEVFCAALRKLGVEVATGVFGARMVVELVNDGPLTIVLGG